MPHDPAAVGRNNVRGGRVLWPYTMGCLIILLVLVLATLLAGPIGFVLAAVAIVGWALVTGSLHLLWGLLTLPFRLFDRR